MMLMMLAPFSIVSIIGGAFLHEGVRGGEGGWPCLRCLLLGAAPQIKPFRYCTGSIGMSYFWKVIQGSVRGLMRR